MDRLDTLATSISNITLYDIKAMYNQVYESDMLTFARALSILASKAKNVVLNISEMESKVREATNEEPWCGFLFPVMEISKIKT